MRCGAGRSTGARRSLLRCDGRPRVELPLEALLKVPLDADRPLGHEAPAVVGRGGRVQPGSCSVLSCAAAAAPGG